MGYNFRVEKYEVGYESEDYSLLVALEEIADSLPKSELLDRAIGFVQDFLDGDVLEDFDGEGIQFVIRCNGESKSISIFMTQDLISVVSGGYVQTDNGGDSYTSGTWELPARGHANSFCDIARDAIDIVRCGGVIELIGGMGPDLEDDSAVAIAEELVTSVMSSDCKTFEYAATYLAAEERLAFEAIYPSLLKLWNDEAREVGLPTVSDRHAENVRILLETYRKGHRSESRCEILGLRCWSPIKRLAPALYDEEDVEYCLYKEGLLDYEVVVVHLKRHENVNKYRLPPEAALQVSLILDFGRLPIAVEPIPDYLDVSSVRLKFNAGLGGASYSWQLEGPPEWLILSELAFIVFNGKPSKHFSELSLYSRYIPQEHTDESLFWAYPRCIHCGTLLPKESNYCPQCGVRSVATAFKDPSKEESVKAFLEKYGEARQLVENFNMIVDDAMMYAKANPIEGHRRFSLLIAMGRRCIAKMKEREIAGARFNFPKTHSVLVKTALYCLSLYAKETRDWDMCLSRLKSANAHEWEFEAKCRLEDAIKRCEARIRCERRAEENREKSGA